MTSEASRLREVVQEQKDEIERLREALKSIAKAPHPVRSNNLSQLISDIKDTAASALDGGGDAS
jgi:LPS O-antigen subunit length determinant protein (WzzB/FepE family)